MNASGPRVRMCRGCCCGTTGKHPDVDHEGIADVLGTAIGPEARLTRVGCLWACDLSNVVVVNPAVEGRRRGARPAWVTKVNTVERARAVADWVRRGGPGLAEPPEELGEVLSAAGLRRVSAPGR
ncbi:Uncharacterised protein [Amycolatopsis camponoti]|uniref:(2Fe-2S) ferredoxin domain-containing protein n=1 Tax=Amycolatopsis camponoti TaxID=2606593 RepID=A0A6I8LQV2_9PSEU|nr:hypothetical protein [Amycolatopsis camponoti]VVJ17469.1 Uncharacterised protein [Amycolatopsis camponoti]